MRYKYDPQTDILLIELGRGKPDFGEQKENVITHYNKRGVPMEIEILDASKTIAKLVDVVLSTSRAKAYAYS
jgi:uncharacterized protein YuzE